MQSPNSSSDSAVSVYTGPILKKIQAAKPIEKIDSSSTEAFIKSIADRVRILAGKNNLYASIILAQAILDGVSQISVFVRSVSMEKTRPYLDKLQEQTGFKVDLYALEDVSELQARIAESDLLVNATSVGMDGQSSPVPENIVLPETLLVADIIYKPFETPFLKWARSQGNPVVNGLGMLLYQAAEAFQLWTGKEMPTEEIWQSLTEKYQ